MAAVTTTIFTCDRDGAVSDSVTGGMPPGWSTVNVSTTVAPPPPEGEGKGFTSPFARMTTMVLCPACSGAALEVMKKAY